MRTLYIVGGAMGVGKTTTCRLLCERLENSALLDGDCLWDLHPFRVTDVTKRLVCDNIVAVLNNFLACSELENIVFCWVLHRQDILDGLLSRLHTAGWNVRRISLTCTEPALRARLEKDVRAGLRRPDVIGRSLAYLPLYAALDTEKLDVSLITPEEAAEGILLGGLR